MQERTCICVSVVVAAACLAALARVEPRDVAAA